MVAGWDAVRTLTVWEKFRWPPISARSLHCSLTWKRNQCSAGQKGFQTGQLSRSCSRSHSASPSHYLSLTHSAVSGSLIVDVVVECVGKFFIFNCTRRRELRQKPKILKRLPELPALLKAHLVVRQSLSMLLLLLLLLLRLALPDLAHLQISPSTKRVCMPNAPFYGNSWQRRSRGWHPGNASI